MALRGERAESSQVCSKFRLSPAMVRTSRLAARLFALLTRTKWNKVYRLFHVAIKIGDVATQALVDTGASVSAISEFLFSRLPLETRNDKIESKDEKLNSICGQEIGIKGIYEIPLSLDTDENKITHQF